MSVATITAKFTHAQGQGKEHKGSVTGIKTVRNRDTNGQGQGQGHGHRNFNDELTKK
jgi:hypothetical protein